MLKLAMPFPLPEAETRQVRLNTLIMLRWTAVAGQIVALLAATLWFGIDAPLMACAVLIAAPVLANILLMALYPAQRGLTGGETFAMLSFDLLQLCVLLAITGGVNNPFAMLVLAPVVIGAAALSGRLALILGGTAVVLISAAAWVGDPLPHYDGSHTAVPPLFAFGHWLAIVISVGFVGLYTRRVATELHSTAQALFATQLALAREQRLCDLGGVVAAYAHELGTPLATIKLTGAELADDLAEALPARSDLAGDAALIRDQAARCTRILQEMGRIGKDDLHLRDAPLEALLHEAAEPHQARGIDLRLDLGAAGHRAVPRQPELIHGLRNLIQNAVDFAQSTVWVEAGLTASPPELWLRIADDGPGYPPQLLPRIGAPFISQRQPASPREGYDGMGLGLFIAKTLLERTGARLRFLNGPPEDARGDREKTGAMVELRWSLDKIESRTPTDGLGANPLNR